MRFGEALCVAGANKGTSLRSNKGIPLRSNKRRATKDRKKAFAHAQDNSIMSVSNAR